MVEFSLKLDEQLYKVSPMQNLRVFIEAQGIQNFGLCHHEKIISAGKCDLCLVEVNGELVRSCEVFVNSDMEVSTRSERTEHGLKESFSLLAKDHKTDCERCHQSGICKIQNLARTHVINLGTFEGQQETNISELGNGYQLEHERCVNCTLCIDYSQKIAKDDLFFHYGRGSEQRVDFNTDAKNLAELWRYRDLCPTGAIFHRDDLKIGERGKWHDVTCVGCDQACTLKARTIAKRFVDIRTPGIDAKSCEAGRVWWRSIDLWRAHSGIALRSENGEMVPASLSEVRESIPKNLKWRVLLPSDLNSQELDEWARVIKASRLEANIFLPERKQYHFEAGPGESYISSEQGFMPTQELLGEYDGLIVVEPLWRYSAEFLQKLKSRCRELVLFSSGPLIDNLSLVQINRLNWLVSPLLPARQSEALQGIIDVLQIKD